MILKPNEVVELENKFIQFDGLENKDIRNLFDILVRVVYLFHSAIMDTIKELEKVIEDKG